MTRCSRWVRKSCYCVLGRLAILYNLQNTSRKMSSYIRWGMVSDAAESLWKVANKNQGLHITTDLGVVVFKYCMGRLSPSIYALISVTRHFCFSTCGERYSAWQLKVLLVFCTCAVVLKFLRSSLHIQINRSVSKWRGLSVNASYMK